MSKIPGLTRLPTLEFPNPLNVDKPTYLGAKFKYRPKPPLVGKGNPKNLNGPWVQTLNWKESLEPKITSARWQI